MKTKYIFACLLAGSMLAGGCATKIKVTSEPSGAMIRYRGEGRASYRWKTAPTLTPCEFSVPYGRISAYAIWPGPAQAGDESGAMNGIHSEKKQVDLSLLRDEESIHFTKPK